MVYIRSMYLDEALYLDIDQQITKYCQLYEYLNNGITINSTIIMKHPV